MESNFEGQVLTREPLPLRTTSLAEARVVLSGILQWLMTAVLAED
jgi:hypothetical protein